MLPLVDVLKKTTDFFKKKGIASPRLDAELIIGHVLGHDNCTFLIPLCQL